tara:strand:+ start:13169 stop:13777 length:609 start_codon:yes stop_codon:yes gene_type:complete
MNEAIRMQLSAFVDGELPSNEAELLLRRMSQDVSLRQEVAEYLAIGRLIRAEAGLAGADRLYQRVAAELADRPVDSGDAAGSRRTTKALRPLVGFAIAATVALVAIFSLQQTGNIDELAPGDVPQLADEPGPVVPIPDAQQERQREIFHRHAETASQLGANGMNSRVVTLRFSNDLDEEGLVEDLADTEEDSPATDNSVPSP